MSIPAPETAASDWGAVDLGPYLRGEMPDVPQPSLGALGERGYLLYPGKLHLLSGEPEGLKSWVAQVCAAEAMRDRQNVLYIDHEKYPGDIAERLLALGLSPELIEHRFRYVRPESPPDDRARADLLALAHELEPGLTVVDGIGMAMGACGLDPHSAGDYLRWLTADAKPLQRATPGPTVMTDHVRQGAEKDHRYSAGSYQKLAQIDVHIGVCCTRKFGRGRSGRAILRLHKDTPGWLRSIERDGALTTLSLASDPETGEVVHTFDEPVAVAEFRPTDAMAKISAYLEGEPDKQAATRRVEDAMPFRRDTTRTALGLLVNEGYVERSNGKNGAKVHVSKRPYAGAELAAPSPNGHGPELAP